MPLGIGSPVVEQITYAPGLKNTTDLEGATKTITATAEATGVGNADYSAALTIAAPTDARLAVNRIAARLSFTIDSFDTATILYCRVYVDSQDADHRLFDTSHNATSNKLAAADTLVGTKEVIFNLLKDGAAHTFYFFFWVNQAVNAVISVCQLWEVVGNAAQIMGGTPLVMTLTHSGFVSVSGQLSVLGTGTPLLRAAFAGMIETQAFYGSISGSNALVQIPSVLAYNGVAIFLASSVNTDLEYLAALTFNLRTN